jgi:hypothetical protein
MERKISAINELLCKKSHAKQIAYQTTLKYFEALKLEMRELEEEIMPCIQDDAPSVKIRYTDIGQFEAHLAFGGDTLVAMMHTNIFDFEDEHYISKNQYIVEDPTREFCGMIQIYNFLTDSLNYNRVQDMGYMVARIFINKEGQFFVEGKRPLSFLYSDIAKQKIDGPSLRYILEECMLYCLNFDLLAPPVEAVKYITLEQKLAMSFSLGLPTSKRMGFRMEKDEDDV